MSRPSKREAEKLSYVLPPVRCTAEEKQVIKDRSQKAGLSMSEYIRQMALKGKVTIRQNQVDFETVHQLRKLGVNINQQTKALHATGILPLELKKLWAKLETILDQMMD